jgi:glycerol-3-phosphate acyltransferase PlsY
MTRPFFFVLFAYLLGSLPVGILLSKLKGQDPRRTGSGNIGATNVMRTSGRVLGIFTLLGDALKGLLPVLFAIFVGESPLVVALVALAAFTGHLFPIYLKFRGGKGVSTSLGIFLALNPLAITIALVIFIIVVAVSRYVSLGSLLGAALMPLILWLLGSPVEYHILGLIMAILIFLKHSDNIKRLLRGKENKFGMGKRVNDRS